MFPEFFELYFSTHQDLLYFVTLVLDLGFTVLMYRFFGRYGLLACIVLSILLANLQGPKLTVIFGMETSLGVIFYSSIFFATDLMSEKFGKKAGVSLNPKTTIEKVMPVLGLIDLVLIMSVNPGFGGQKFIKETLEKVKLLRKEIDQKKLAVEIEIDGGINFDNAKIAKKAGVDILVSGTTIFKNNEGNIKKNIETLRNH